MEKTFKTKRDIITIFTSVASSFPSVAEKPEIFRFSQSNRCLNHFESRQEHTILRWFCSIKRKCLLQVEALYASVKARLIPVRVTKG